MKVSKSDFLGHFFGSSSDKIDVHSILSAWQALDNVYDVESWQLPMPLWAKRPYDHSGDYAWQVLQHDLAKTNPEKPTCIYIHIPFCSRKCGFCDSYSFKLGSHKEEHIKKYKELICSELEIWSGLGNLSQRPISTIHLGGGTPTFIGPEAIAEIIHCCQENFFTSNSTELAIEATVEDLTPTMISRLHDIGFRRLHVGIQSMQENVRLTIGRLCPSSDSLKSIENALGFGWVVSVDLLYGLPGQTLSGFIQGIEDLVNVGVNGFSLYELIIRQQNYQWAYKNNLVNRSHLANYFLVQAGALFLDSHGYKKNFYNHWADKNDTNIYFTFPIRGEDCLAIGTVADGVFEDYHYRHPTYTNYTRGSLCNASVLEGGLRKSQFEQLLYPFETAIFSGYIEPEVVNKLNTIQDDTASLLHKWLRHKMFEQNINGGLNLTTNGTWFAGNLINELTVHFKNTL